MIPTLGACTVLSLDCPRAVLVPGEARLERWLKDELRRIRRDKYIRIADRLCTRTTCVVTAGATPVFYDVVHLNATLTARFASAFAWPFKAR